PGRWGPPPAPAAAPRELPPHRRRSSAGPPPRAPRGSARAVARPRGSRVRLAPPWISARAPLARNRPWVGRRVGLEDRLDRRVVAEPRLAPLVHVIAVDRPQAPRGEHVVQPVSRLSPPPRVEDPADVAAVEAVELAEDVE